MNQKVILSAVAALAATTATAIISQNAIGGGNGGTVCGATSGPDVIIGSLSGISNYSSVGGIEAFSVGTTSCNIGDQVLAWDADDTDHPVIAQHMYRLKDGRFEQIGISWLKHGFAALTGNECGCGCQSPGNSQVLGVGCSDPYSSSLNGDQNGNGGSTGGLGPRFQVNAHTGGFSWPYFAQGQSGNSIYKRLQVKISDLDPGQDGGGQYFVEGQYVTPDDAAAGNQDNNCSYRPCTISGGGSSWSASTTGSTVREKPAIRAWKAADASVVETDMRVPGEGLFILAAKASDNGDGTWNYEYALYNQNSDRSGRSFSVPYPAGANITNVGFHDVDYHSGDGEAGVSRDGTDWSVSIGSNSITWSTDTEANDSNANALRWGTLYNFRFDADVPPAETTATVGLYKAGSPADITGTTTGPDMTNNSQFAVAFNVNVNEGTLTGGDVASLDAEDDDYIEVEGNLDGSKYRTRTIIKLTSPLLSVSRLDVRVETGCNDDLTGLPFQKVHLWNWNTSTWRTLGTGLQAKEDTLYEFLDQPNPNRFVNAATGEVRIRIFDVVQESKAPNGLQNRIDLVEVEVQP